MSDNLPESFDISRFDTNGAEFKGDFALSKMPRLESMLGSDGNDDSAACMVDLSLSPRTRLGFELNGTIRATVHLVCQRCLDTMAYPIDATVALRLSETDAEETDVLLDEERILSLLEVVEDELMLHVPPIPKHADASACNTEMISRATEYVPDEAEEEANNPFSVLKNLKK